MARQTAFPTTLAPRLISRATAAIYVCVAPATFDQMVRDGKMPQAKVLSERRIAWDIRDLDEAIDRLPVRGNGQIDDTTWSDISAT